MLWAISETTAVLVIRGALRNKLFGYQRVGPFIFVSVAKIYH